METNIENEKPDTPDHDWDVMSKYWERVAALVEGRDAVVELGTDLLPQFPHESSADYALRLKLAKYTNVYRDILEGLASKPFAHDLVMTDESNARLAELAEDIDGRGNNLHVFAGCTFFDGINNAIEWILVDYTRSEGLRTVADEVQAGVRPYWVHVPAAAVIWTESDVIQGREQLTKVKIKEAKNKVRTYERDESGKVTWRVEVMKRMGEWEVEDEGDITIGVIPMVPFITGRRKGSKWQFYPPMRDAADLQVNLYNLETSLNYTEAMTCFPMVAANGVAPEMEGGTPKPIALGPKAVLYAPPDADGNHGEWKFMEPSAQSLHFMAEDIKETKKELREIGRQPLTAQSGNLTVITTAFAAQKGNSAVQAWAYQLKDALENAFTITAMWLGLTDANAEVSVFTDFGVDDLDSEAPRYLLDAYAAGLISAQTFREEYKRRGILGPEFDEDREVTERIFMELPGGDSEIGSDEL